LLPIYLASQTVPMLAELMNTEGKAGKASGIVLFYSTLGSVAGGIVTPVWLFPYIGVTRSTYVVCGVLGAIAAALAIGAVRKSKAAVWGAGALAAVLAANAAVSPGDALYSFDSAYQSVRIVKEKDDGGRMERVLIMSGSRSSGIYADNGETSFEYVRAAEQALAEVRPGRALVIGAAGFTFPRDVARLPFVQQVDAVDVDPVVRTIAEREFLKQPLPAKVRFLPLSARYAVRKLLADSAHYGFSFVDAYFGKGIPDELVTVEFFRDVRQVSEHTAANIVMDRTMNSAFARNTLATFRAAFGEAWVRDVRPGDDDLTNILVTSWPAGGAAHWNGRGDLYRDDRNSADRDHVQMVWGSGED
jgi:spermidine synthase